RLIDVPVSAGGEGTLLEPRLFVYEAEMPAASSRFYAHILGRHHADSAMVRGFPGLVAAPVVRRREQGVLDRDWYGSVEFNEAFRPDGIDGGIISTHPLPDGSLDILTAHPRLGRGLGRRETLLVHLVHREIAPLVGRTLAGSWEPNLAGLSPRMRQTL